MIAFRKVHGAGIDFILVADPREARDWGELAARLCRRRTGIGGDGPVVSERISASAYAVTCCNPDGSVASMCGNALRCAARCAADDYGETRMTLTMGGVSHQAIADRSQIAVTVFTGPVTPRLLVIQREGERLEFAFVDTGTEHVVALAEAVGQIDVASMGRRISHHSVLAPAGANVNFVQLLHRGAVKVRTYERGVEAETLSCGSGAVAAVAVARHAGLVTQGPVTVCNEAGMPLVVGPVGDPQDGTVWLTGPARIVYRGEAA
jgi:diaminopimelate epimerase